MRRMVLAFEVSGIWQQIHALDGVEFVRSSYCTAYLRNEFGQEVQVPLVVGPGVSVFAPTVGGPTYQFERVFPGSPNYVPGFELSEPLDGHDLAAGDRAVPSDTTVVVITGAMGEHATVFHGGHRVSTVRDGGKFSVASVPF